MNLDRRIARDNGTLMSWHQPLCSTNFVWFIIIVLHLQYWKYILSFRSARMCQSLENKLNCLWVLIIPLGGKQPIEWQKYIMSLASDESGNYRNVIPVTCVISNTIIILSRTVLKIGTPQLEKCIYLYLCRKYTKHWGNKPAFYEFSAWYF